MLAFTDEGKIGRVAPKPIVRAVTPAMFSQPGIPTQSLSSSHTQ